MLKITSRVIVIVVSAVGLWPSRGAAHVIERVSIDSDEFQVTGTRF